MKKEHLQKDVMSRMTKEGITIYKLSKILEIESASVHRFIRKGIGPNCQNTLKLMSFAYPDGKFPAENVSIS